MKNLLLTLLLIATTVQATSTDVKAYCEAGKYSNDPHFASLDPQLLAQMDKAYMEACLATMSQSVNP